MSLPVLVVAGFLGAGKTTFINQLLTGAQGLRIAAIVNDFGAINIDENLITDRSDGVIGLANGCICCSLQGDLLRTLKVVLDRPDRPDHVVIEASGVSDPQGIVDAVTDPALWPALRLNGVLTVVDAQDCRTSPGRMSDPVWQAQVAGADLIVLAKAGGIDTTSLRVHLAPLTQGRILLPGDDGLPLDLILGPRPDHPRLPRRVISDSRFVSLEFETEGPAEMAAFQAAIETLAPSIIRAKGLLSFAERPDQMIEFQMVGRRATLEPRDGRAGACKLVLIGERGTFDPAEAKRLLGPALARE